MNDVICELCNKSNDDLEERYVPSKQKLMSVCKQCMYDHITYSPDSMGLPSGDVHLDE